jgi:hypothetical protein
MLPDKNKMNEWDALEAFLNNSKHYWHPNYKKCYKHENLSDEPDQFMKTIGQENCSQREFSDMVEDGYADFWEKRGRGKDAFDPYVAKYVSDFFEIYEGGKIETSL